MDEWRKLQFMLAGLLQTGGCAALLFDASNGVPTFLFCAAPLILLRKSEVSRPVSRRDFWMLLAVSLLLVAYVFIRRLFVADSAVQSLFRQPAVVGLLWILLMSLLITIWRREKRSQPNA